MGKGPKVISILLFIVGGVLFVLGVSTYVTVSVVLSKQQISVPTSQVPCAAGMTVDNPYASWCMARKIDNDVLAATKGQTYATLPQNSPNENMSLEGALLQAALYTAIEGFGVALLVAGMGVIALLSGAGIWMLNSKPKEQTATAPPVTLPA